MRLPRILVGLVLLLAVAGAAGSAHAQGSDPPPTPRVVIAFLPAGGDDNPPPVVDRLRPLPLAMGLMSMTQGRYSPSQALVDISSGTRTSLAAYSPQRAPELSFVQGGDGTGFISRWKEAVERADTATADIHPGLLASAIPGGAAYVGLDGRDNLEAVAAADREGDIAAADIGGSDDQTERVAAALAGHRLVVAGLATGAKGDEAVQRLVRERRAEDLLIVIQAPPQSRQLQLLPVGVSGLGGRRGLTSQTTHIEGLVAGIDVPATVLRFLRIEEPKGVKGQRMEAEGPRNLDSLLELDDRLQVVGERRTPALGGILLSWAALILLLGLVADRRGVYAALRIGGLAVLWGLPLLLLTGWMSPSKATEIIVIAGGGMLLGAVTDRLVAWPRAPAVPAGIAFVAYVVDLAAGSPLIVRSLLGVSARSGGRFYGLTNELEATLSVLLLIGVGAVLVAAGKSLRAAAAFAVAGAALCVVVGAGRLGADVGGVITVGAGAAVATVMMLPGQLTRKRILLAVAAPAVGLLALALIDVVSGGDGHFTRTILRADSGEDLWNVVERRYTLAWSNLERDAMPYMTTLALLAGAYAWKYRMRVYAPVGGSAAWHAALTGGFVGVVVGSLTNDSGPVLLVFGTFVLAAVTAYLRGDPALAAEEPPVGTSH